jgi:NitT/TauT family transport system permease protein
VSEEVSARLRTPFSRALVLERSWPVVLDLLVAIVLLAGFYGVLLIARYWAGGAVPEVEISLSPSHLPVYAFYSTVRIFVAYALSLAFAIGYGYLAAYNPRLEPWMIALLDILQSIPVLSFLPGVMLAMMALIPTRQLGIEFGAIILIFTGEVWNMAFSFYSSLKAIPRELNEAAKINGFSPLQKLIQLELPYAAIGLVWNSMVSVASGWFFLIASEMFPLGSRNFRLPGLGSYLQTAASRGDSRAMVYGLLTVLFIILATDQLLWRPIIDWSDKFKFENVESADRSHSPILSLLRRSDLLARLRSRTVEPLSERVWKRLAQGAEHRPVQMEDDPQSRPAWLVWLLGSVLVAVAAYAAFKALVLLRAVPGAEYLLLLRGAGATFLRVTVALALAAAWTIPAGVAIGFSPRLARIAQPLAQIAASFPATALFPLILLALMRLGAGLNIGAVALMMLGTQWYILFNVIAGAMAIPSDLKEAANLFHFTTLQRWTTVILPGIFPYLITGLITASGGAWNASILSEYFHLKGHTLTTLGLGAIISAASDAGSFSILLLATMMMATMVVTVNRLLWRPLNRLAESKYRLD